MASKSKNRVLLEGKVAIMNSRIGSERFSIEGAYDGWRVWDNVRCGDALGSGYVNQPKLAGIIDGWISGYRMAKDTIKSLVPLSEETISNGVAENNIVAEGSFRMGIKFAEHEHRIGE